MDFKRRYFKENAVEYWAFCIMDQTLFVRNKHIIIRMLHFLHRNFVLICYVIMWEEIFQYPLVLYHTYLLLGSEPDAISLVVLTLGIRVVLFYSEVAKVLETDPLSLLSSSIYYMLQALGINHGTEADFPQRLLSIPPRPPP